MKVLKSMLTVEIEEKMTFCIQGGKFTEFIRNEERKFIVDVKSD